MKLDGMPAGGLARVAPDANARHLVAATAKRVTRKRYNLLDFTIPEGLIFLALLFLVYLTTYYYSYLLFHTLSELFSIFIAITITIITINCFGSIENQYISFVGISYFFVGLLDLMHTLSFKGIPIFTDYDYYAPQFWIAARYVESLSMLAGFGLLDTKRRIDPILVTAVYAVITASLVAAILYLRIFPVCFVAGKGLTPFKIYSEYAICAVLIGSIVLLYIHRQQFETRFYHQLLTALVLMVLMELCFTLFVSDAMNDAFNKIGHLLKICAFYLIYKAVVVTALRDPIHLLFRELTASESCLREAQQLARLGRWELALETGAWTWTEEMYHFFSVSAASAPTLEAMLAPLRPKDRQTLRALLSRSASQGGPFEFMLRIEDAAGLARFGQLRGEVLRDENGGVASLLGTLQDVTEEQLLIEGLRERTAEMLAARDAAEAANKAKSTFLANMSHELRTPLNAILGFSSLMRREPGITAGQQETLDIINRSGEHLLTLINDVLEMAKIEAGRLHLEIAPLDLGRVMRDVAGMMDIRAREKGLLLLLDQSSSFPRYIKGDEARLRQILVNLTGNAVKFTKEGGVTIRLGMRPEDPRSSSPEGGSANKPRSSSPEGGSANKPRSSSPEGGSAVKHLIIEVEDTGPGIAPEDQSRLFQPFVQLAESSMQKGTGLGLAITRQFVELMGGTISLESTPGKGSIFRIELPVELVAEATAGIEPEGAQAGEICGLEPGQPEFRILIAEDQRDNQVLLMRLMADIGLAARLAENGGQCVAMFEEWHPHLIWMDRRMPVMDGVEATRRIRELAGGREVKIVAVTASAFREERQLLLDAGMDDFVRKPYHSSEIYDALARHLGVKYLYRSGLAQAKPAGPIVLTPEKLAGLPAVMRQELRDALLSLDSERIAAAIQKVSGADAELGLTLARLAETFDYSPVLNALEAQTRCPVEAAQVP